jgi:hypothetical protein
LRGANNISDEEKEATYFKRKICPVVIIFTQLFPKIKNK